jgi:hypothetical protein
VSGSVLLQPDESGRKNTVSTLPTKAFPANGRLLAIFYIKSGIIYSRGVWKKALLIFGFDAYKIS